MPFSEAAQRVAAASEAQAEAAQLSIETTVSTFRLDQRHGCPVQVADPLYVQDGKRVYIKLGEKTRFAFVLESLATPPPEN